MYLIQDVQILMNSWMIHVLKLKNLNQISNTMSTILVILIGLGIIVLCGMAIKYSESAVSLLPGVLLGIVMLLLTVEHSNDRKENVRDIISNFTKTYCTPVKITSISLIQYLPDGCSEYMVIAVTRDSTYTYSAVLDPEKTEVINFILEESIPRLENYQNK